MPRNRKWGALSKSARERAARAGKQYGLNRNAVRHRYNRGTYNPLSRDSLQKLPRELRTHADPVTGDVDWTRLALENMERHLSDYDYKYEYDTVVAFTEAMSQDVAKIVALATRDELQAYAAPQPDRKGKPPPIEQWGLPPSITLADVSVIINGEWNNIFWYH